MFISVLLCFSLIAWSAKVNADDSNLTANITENVSSNLTNTTADFQDINITSPENTTANTTNTTADFQDINITSPENATLNMTLPLNFSNISGISNISGENTSLPPNITRVWNISGSDINISGSVPYEISQGPARVGSSVSWNRRIIVNQTGHLLLRSFIPKGATAIEVFFTPLSEHRTIGVAEVSPRGLNSDKISLGSPQFISVTDKVYIQDNSAASFPTGSAVLESGKHSSVLASVISWIASILGFSGASVLSDSPVQLLLPEENASVERNFNLIYETDREFDACYFYVDSQLNDTDPLVLKGTNFFELRDVNPGVHSWQVTCILNNEFFYSPIWHFSSGETLDVFAGLDNVSIGNISLFALPESQGEFMELNITDDVAEPGVYDIVYDTPAPESFETEYGIQRKTVTLTSEIVYRDVTATTDIPWVPDWMVKLNRRLNDSAYERVEEFKVLDRNNDSLYDAAEWVVPDLGYEVYEIDLSYDIPELALREAILTDGKSENDQVYASGEEPAKASNESYNITPILLDEGFNVTFIDSSPLTVSFNFSLEENDTVSIYAFASSDGLLTIVDPSTGNPISKITLIGDSWQSYNLTIQSPVNLSSVTVISDTGVVYDRISAFDKKVMIPKRIASLPENLRAYSGDNYSTDAVSQRTFREETVLLKEVSGVPIGSFGIFFANAESDIDLKGISAETSLDEKKTLLHFKEQDVLFSREKTIYIPSSGEGIVYICPYASSLSDINNSCPGRFYAYPGRNIINLTGINPGDANGTDTSGIAGASSNSEMLAVQMEEITFENMSYYKVDGLRGTGGGEGIRIINTKSRPKPGGNWTVLFTTKGSNELRITPFRNTTFAELRTDANITEDDLDFIDISCGGISLADSILLIGNGSNTTYSLLAENDSFFVNSILIENYSCLGTGEFRINELTGGHHFLLFSFGDQIAIAENYISQLYCNITDSCSYTDILHISSLSNAHSELRNQSYYQNKVCCREVYGEIVGTNCSAEDAEPILRLQSQTNSHVEKVSESTFQHEVCLSGTSNYNITCTYSTSCAAYDTCLLSISSTETGSDTNLMAGNCTGISAYATKVCCDTQEVSTCIIPYDDYTATQDITICAGSYLLNDAANDGLIKVGADSITITCNSTSITGMNQGFGVYLNGKDDVTLIGCTIANFTRAVSVNNTSNSTFRNNSFINNTFGAYLANSSGNVFYYNNFTGSGSYHAYSDSSANHFNTTVSTVPKGNFWDDVSSLNIYDTNSDGFGDSGPQYPYNSSVSGKVTQNVTDYGPVTSKTPPISTSQIDPLDSWVLNSTIKFECNATSNLNLVNGSLWHNYSGIWVRDSTKLISGTYSEFEFNTSGFSAEKTFLWGCEACHTDQCKFSGNRSITIDNTRPGISFVSPTPTGNARNSTALNWAYVNVSTSDLSNRSVFIDWNRSLLGWWRFENNSLDSSTYGHSCSCAGAGCPELWTGARGKAYLFNTLGTIYYDCGGASTLNVGTSDFTIMVWVKTNGSQCSYCSIIDKYSGPGYFVALNGFTPRIFMNNATGPYLWADVGSGQVPDRVWTHLAFAFNRSSVVTAYINGVQSGTLSITSMNMSIDSAVNAFIGYERVDGGRFRGAIDNVQVHKRLLSAQEINASYQNQLVPLYRNFTGLVSGRYNYTSYVVDMAGNLNQTEYRNFSVNYMPVVSNVVLNSTYNTNYTNENLTVWYSTSDTDGDVRKNITNWYLNSRSIAFLNMPFEPAGGYNESSWVDDYSGAGRYGTTVGTVTYNSTGGYDGRGAYYFDGANNTGWIATTVPTEASGGFSISAWIKPMALNGKWNMIFGGCTGHFYFAIVNNGLIFSYGNATGSQKTFQSVAFPQAGVWYHVTATLHSNSTAVLYINGALSAAQTLNQGIYPIIPAARYIGSFATAACVGYYAKFNGTIDDLVFFNRSLSAQEVNALYMNKTGLLVSQEINTGNIWQACITPNDGIEDGTEVCSNQLTIKSCATPYDDFTATADTTFCAGTYYLSDPAADGLIRAGSSNIKINCNSTVIIGSNAGYGFYAGGKTALSLVGCTFRNFSAGIYLNSSQDSNFTNNSLVNNTYGAYLKDSAGNRFYYNNFTGSASYHAFSNIVGNHFNTTNGSGCGALCARGNFWDDVENLKIYDTNGDNYGDAGVQYPYNSTFSSKVNSNITDYGPFAPKTGVTSAPILVKPANNSIITDSRNPIYIWNNSVHTLSDNITYRIQVDETVDFNSPVIDTSNISEGIVNSSYWNSTSLQFTIDYYWRVRAVDPFQGSDWSGIFHFNILPTTSCTQPVDEVDFGNMCINPNQAICDANGWGSHINDTLDNHPPPYITDNNGNLKIKGKSHSTKLWTTPSIVFMPDRHYQYMMGVGESGSYEWALDSYWVNMTNSSSSALEGFYGFKWENVSDAMKLHIRLEAPDDEPAGAKYSTTTVTCEQNETYY